jgi:hypothetical protein
MTEIILIEPISGSAVDRLREVLAVAGDPELWRSLVPET